MVERDSPLLSYMPVEKALLKEGECFAFRNKWWACCPQRGLIFYKFDGIRPALAQCYVTKEIAESQIAQMFPWAEAKFMELVLSENEKRLFYD